MSKKPSHHGENWTRTEIKRLEELVRENTPTRVMAIKLGRTPEAVRAKASRLGISLAPWNRPPRKPRT